MWPKVERVVVDEQMLALIKKREECWQQYMDGAITFIEACNWLYASITEEELRVYKQYEEQFQVEGRAKSIADWMFRLVRIKK